MTTITNEPIEWSAPKKIAFRFFFAFFVLYVFFQPNGIIPFSDNFNEFYLHPMLQFIPWLANHLLHIKVTVFSYQSGSGDRAFDYLVYLLIVILALITCGIWSVFGKNIKNHSKLLYWLCVVIRYYAGITMLTYGGVKVIKLQFADPTPMKLIEPVGDLSPFSLAWTYMGHSVGFNYFAGMAEITCGLLMFWRRTTTLGAVVGFVVAGNIVAINYCFDVCVKLLATNLLLMFTFLLVLDWKRLYNVFLANENAPPADISAPLFKKRWKNIAITTFKYVLLAYVILGDGYNFIDASKKYGDNSKKPPLYGIYNVQYFVRNEDTLAPLTTDTLRWRKLMINKYEDGAVKLMNDSVKAYAIKDDTLKHQLIINTHADTVHKFRLNYTVVKPDILMLKGAWKKDSIKVKLVKYDMKKYTLLNRGFHWVNENAYSK